ncbi:type II toxin-antitoxin system VapC family toxin [bacterium]|nr:type II toxin-antitoxin system VapC family toxin [bacterium]
MTLFEQRTQGLYTFLAPDFIYAEVANAVLKYYRSKRFDLDDTKLLLDTFVAVPIRLFSASDLMFDAYTIAIQHTRSVYDSLYIALAQRENTTFVTADEKLYNAVSSALPVTFLAHWQ